MIELVEYPSTTKHSQNQHLRELATVILITMGFFQGDVHLNKKAQSVASYKTSSSSKGMLDEDLEKIR